MYKNSGNSRFAGNGVRTMASMDYPNYNEAFFRRYWSDVVDYDFKSIKGRTDPGINYYNFWTRDRILPDSSKII